MRTVFCALFGIIGLSLIKGQDTSPYKPLDLSYRYQPPDLDPNDPRAKFLRPANVVIRFSRGPVSGVVDNSSQKEVKEKIQEQKQFIFVQQPNADVNGSPAQSPKPSHQPDSGLTFQPPQQLHIPFTARQSTTPQASVPLKPFFAASLGGTSQEIPLVHIVEDDSLRQNPTQQRRPLHFFQQHSFTKEDSEEETGSLQPIPQTKSVKNDNFSRKPIPQLGRPMHVLAQHSLNDEEIIKGNTPTRQIPLLQPTRENYLKGNQQPHLPFQHSAKNDEVSRPIANGSHQQFGVTLNSPETTLKKIPPQLKKAHSQSTPKFQQVIPQQSAVQKYEDDGQQSLVQHSSSLNTFYRKNLKQQKPVPVPTVRYRVSELPRRYRQQQRQKIETKSNRGEDFDHQLGIDVEGDLSAIPGKAGSDYPTISEIPRTSFTCEGKLPGFYASVEYRCQLYHHCSPQGRMQSFLCPNGTVYNQLSFVCEWWYNVDCGNSEDYFKRNNDLYKLPEPTDEKKLKVELNPARFKPAPATSKHRSTSVAAPPPDTTRYLSLQAAVPNPSTIQHRSPLATTSSTATSKHRSTSAVAPPPDTTRYLSLQAAVPNPSTVQHRSPLATASSPATSKHRTTLAAAPNPQTSQYRSPSAAAPSPAISQYRSPLVAAPSPAISQYRLAATVAPFSTPIRIYDLPPVIKPPSSSIQGNEKASAAAPLPPPVQRSGQSSIAVSPVQNFDQFSSLTTQDNGALSVQPHKPYIFGRRLTVENQTKQK